MAKALALLLLACFGTADATLGEFMKSSSMIGKTVDNLDYGALCDSMTTNGAYQGKSWSMGGGATILNINCGKEVVVVACKGYPTFTSCTSNSGGASGAASCMCPKAHPKCESNAWCYNAQDWSTSVCPGSCTADAAGHSCQCPAAYPSCNAKNHWCYTSDKTSYTWTCARLCTATATPPVPPPQPTAPPTCTCPATHPFCYSGNQWCFKSASSSAYTQKCSKRCTDSAAPDPAAPTLAPTSGSAGQLKAVTAPCAGSSDSFTQAEAQLMLDLHNKFRCAVGTPAINWDTALACQAQKTQDSIGAFSHSNSYQKPISAGENLASGSNPSMAAWMWFTEYTQTSSTGHFTAMTWKSSTKLGCGISRVGDGVVRCQYAASAPNYQGEYAANVPAFKGEKAKFDKCGISISEVKKHVMQYKSWGILTPETGQSASLGLFEEEDVAWALGSSGFFTAGVAFAVLSFATAGITLSVRRRWQQRENHASLFVPCDEEHAKEQELTENFDSLE